jgi:TnpA family transposase
MKNIIRLTESELIRVVKRVLNESSETDEIKKITDVKNQIEKILGYYYIDKMIKLLIGN